MILGPDQPPVLTLEYLENKTGNGCCKAKNSNGIIGEGWHKMNELLSNKTVHIYRLYFIQNKPLSNPM